MRVMREQKSKRKKVSNSLFYKRLSGQIEFLRKTSIRQERNLPQEDFAELIGISVDFLSLIERGINAPSFEKLEQMAKRLRVPVKHLFDFSQQRPR
jgi:DNA-binding XRE family transcriptional regulator